ncbi:MAG: hydrogenobyrinic acid a,c-diamide synthase (glutamine-hydrolyzing) [Gammaproteobacteria bacterium]|nr:hydrogenobyrinic acid a,c-diamide synthase (glutamine-hydrolyzing) [Gammaproteobacteria bacterium]
MAHVYISAAHKSSGKTTVSLGIAAALSQRGIGVQPYKKGPDYIDPIWLKTASGRNCYNLDFNTQTHDEILRCFADHLGDSDLALIEGNKGLHDGMDRDGADSNAAMARLLSAPVVLVLDCQGITRNAAPVLLGLQMFDRGVTIAGVILNKTAGERHESKLRSVIEHYTDIPILGTIGRHSDLHIDERHLGLMPSNETDQASRIIDNIARHVTDQVDLDRFLALAGNSHPSTKAITPAAPGKAFRLGIARDAAFGFYYPDDLEAFEQNGAELVFFDTLHDSTLPNVDALFIGGGFPETCMTQLEQNTGMRQSIRRALEAGMPAYAECGGLMYLSRSLAWRGHQANMVGAIPADAVMHERPQGRGYCHYQVSADHPWFTPNHVQENLIHAHEFHYSSLENLPDDSTYAYTIHRGTGIQNRRDGVVIHNLMATYVHQRQTRQHAWVDAFCAFVRQHVTSRNEQSTTARN